MSRVIRVGVVGVGAFGIKHLDAIQRIDDVDVVSLASPNANQTRDIALKYGIPHVSADLYGCLPMPEVEAVILCTPTPLHSMQAIACLKGSWSAARAVAEMQRQTGLVAMCGHTRRFNPSHQWIRRKILAGNFKLQNLIVQTLFLRRTNMNALVQPRSWTDHPLWHHAAHTVDLFAYQTGSPICQINALQGPMDPTLGIAMDMSIQLSADDGALCTLALSFNNDGPFGSTFRYIGDNGTYVARYDDLFDGHGNQIDVSNVDVSLDGIEVQDREFTSAIREGRIPNADVNQLLPCYQLLQQIEQRLGSY